MAKVEGEGKNNMGVAGWGIIAYERDRQNEKGRRSVFQSAVGLRAPAKKGNLQTVISKRKITVLDKVIIKLSGIIFKMFSLCFPPYCFTLQHHILLLCGSGCE